MLGFVDGRACTPMLCVVHVFRIRGLLPGFNGTHWGRLLAVVASKAVTVQAPTPLHRYFAELAAAAPSVRRAAMYAATSTYFYLFSSSVQSSQ